VATIRMPSTVRGVFAGTAATFQQQLDFIQKSGIVTAMVGQLHAPPGTRLVKRMWLEGRLRGHSTGNNTDGTTNIIPKQMSELTKAALAGNLPQATALHQKYFPLFKAVFIEGNPGPIKEAMAMMKLIDSPELRLPMFRMEEANRLRLADALKEFGLLA